MKILTAVLVAVLLSGCVTRYDRDGETGWTFCLLCTSYVTDKTVKVKHGHPLYPDSK